MSSVGNSNSTNRRRVQTGPNGGKYIIDKNGNKRYVPESKKRNSNVGNLMAPSIQNAMFSRLVKNRPPLKNINSIENANKVTKYLFNLKKHIGFKPAYTEYKKNSGLYSPKVNAFFNKYSKPAKWYENPHMKNFPKLLNNNNYRGNISKLYNNKILNSYNFGDLLWFDTGGRMMNSVYIVTHDHKLLHNAAIGNSLLIPYSIAKYVIDFEKKWKNLHLGEDLDVEDLGEISCRPDDKMVVRNLGTALPPNFKLTLVFGFDDGSNEVWFHSGIKYPTKNAFNDIFLKIDFEIGTGFKIKFDPRWTTKKIGERYKEFLATNNSSKRSFSNHPDPSKRNR